MSTSSNFDSLNDDVKLHILKIFGIKSYSIFGSLNRKSNEIFDELNIPKESFIGLLPVSIIDHLYAWRKYSSTAIAKGVVMFNRRDLLDWSVEKQDIKVLKNICYEAAEEGKIEILEEILMKVDESNLESLKSDADICACAAFKGQLKTLKFLQTKNVTWDYWTFSTAAEFGDITVLSWLYANQCPWSELTCSRAAGEGQLHVLIWLREHNCPWNSFACKRAKKGGHHAVLRWLRENGCPE